MSTAPDHRPRPFAALVPNVTVFVSNATIMIVELVAGRLISRHLGMSLYTWTTIIGVVMAGMSLGSYLGGRMADRFRPVRTLSLLFLLAAAGCLSVLPLNAVMGQWTLLWGLSWPLRICIHITLVFAVPAFLLGTISPVVAKMALNLGRKAGRTMGGVYAWGVAGSIIGTFVTGFYLIFYLGVTQIILAAGAVLAALGLAYAAAAHRIAEPLAGPTGRAIPRARVPFRTWFAPNATVFASNAAFMVLELAAARVIAREFGASLYTWTTVIGVVLAGVTLGNALGGRIADRFASGRMVSALFLFASAATLASPKLSRFISARMNETDFLLNLSWPMQIMAYMTFAFFLPCVFIGGISPVVVKRALDQNLAAGRTVGDIYAWGAVGSIVATFLTGYVLIAWIGSLAVIAAVAVLLAAVSLLYAPKGVVPGLWCGVCVLAFAASLLPIGPAEALARAAGLRPPQIPLAVFENESQYSYISVVMEEPDQPNLRKMALDRLVHSKVNLHDPTDLKYDYEWVYDAVIDKFYPDGRAMNTMVIGGGGYAFPHYLEITRPDSYVECSEIDPAVTEAAHIAFGLPRDTKIRIYNMDARNRVADLSRRKRSGEAVPVFDCVFGDSINDYSVPHHLTTLEFTRQIHELMAPDGIYLLNMIDTFDSAAFLGAVVNTCRQVFTFVYAFNTGNPANDRDTFVAICSDRPLNLIDIAERINEKHAYNGNLIAPAAIEQIITRNKNIVLTDNYAPVENLLLPVARARERDLGQVHFDQAERYAAAGRVDDALRKCRNALAVHPQWPKAQVLLADLLKRTGDPEGAVDALEKALDADPDYAPAHIELGHMAMRTGDASGAITHWQRALGQQPDSVALHYNLGLALAASQRIEDAIAHWEKANTLDPAHEDTLHNLALAYTLVGNYDAAWKAVTRIEALGAKPETKLLQTLKQQSSRPAP